MPTYEDAIVEIALESGEEYTGEDIGCWAGDLFDWRTRRPAVTREEEA